MNNAEIKSFHKRISNACYAGDHAELATLLSEGADISGLWAVPDYPLSIAVSSNRLDIVRLLLDNGMPPYMNTKVAQQQYGPVSELTLTGVWAPECHEGVMSLVDRGASMQSSVLSFMPVVRLACMSEYSAGEQSDQFFYCVSDAGVDIDTPIGDGQLLLHFMAGCNNRYVPHFLKNSKNVNAAAENGERALTIAVGRGAHFSVNALLEAGADPHYFVGESRTTLLDHARWVYEYRSDIRLLGKMDGIIDSLKRAGL